MGPGADENFYPAAEPRRGAVPATDAGPAAVPATTGHPTLAGSAAPGEAAMPAGAAAPGEASIPAGAAGAGATPAAGKPADRRRSGWSKLELPLLIAIAIAIAIVLKTFVVQPFYIPSQSMEQTLHGCPGCSGDRILVFKPIYHVRDPHPGDVVVFRAPQDWDELAGVQLSSNPVARVVQQFGQLVGVVPPSEKDLVKRVIAVGGQSVRCCDDNGNVQVSDHGSAGPWRSLNEPYIYQNSPWTKSSTPGVRGPDDSRSFGPVTVPADRLWVRGDHRNDSADSRYHCGDQGPGPNCDPESSTVQVSAVIGKAVVIAWPPARWRTLGTPKTFTSLGLPGPGALPSEPAGFALAGVGLVGGWRRSRRR
jgi:signal peptidase I